MKGILILRDVANGKEIAVHSEGTESMGDNPGYTIPLHSDNWSEALTRIRQEVEFEIVKQYVEPPEDIHCNRGADIDVAKLIPAKPITYTEEEAKNIAWNLWRGSKEEFEEYWNNNKKK